MTRPLLSPSDATLWANLLASIPEVDEPEAVARITRRLRADLRRGSPRAKRLLNSATVVGVTTILRTIRETENPNDSE